MMIRSLEKCGSADLEKGEAEQTGGLEKEESVFSLHSILYTVGPLLPPASVYDLFLSAPIPRLSSLKAQAEYYSHLRP